MQQTRKLDEAGSRRTVAATTSAALVAVAATDTGEPACVLSCKGQSLIARLAAQLRGHGVGRLHVLTLEHWREQVSAAVGDASVRTVKGLPEAFEAIAELATAAPGDVLLAHADLVTHDGVVEGLLADPRVPSGILSASRMPPSAYCPRVRLVRGRVVSSESAFHQVGRPTHAFLGMCKVAAADRDALASVARELADLTREGLPPTWEPELSRKVRGWGTDFYRRAAPSSALAGHLESVDHAAPWLPDPVSIRAELDERFDTVVLRPAAALAEDPVSLCVTGLVRRDVLLTSTYLRDLYWARPLTEHAASEAEHALDEIDEDRVLLDSAVKANDGFFTTFFVSPYSKHLARWCARRGLTPNQVTTFSMLLGVLAAGAFALGTRPGLVVGAVLLQLAFTTDCVDGQLARYTRQFSKLGAWLDSVFDRGKEYVVYAGLAWGAAAAADDGMGWVWLLAAAALGLQTVRHHIDFGYAAQQHGRLAKALHAPLERARDQVGKASPLVEPGYHDLPPGAPGRNDLPAEQADFVAAQAPQSRRSALGGAGVRLSARFEQRPWMRWAKRIVVLPIGERFALISITAAVFDARVTFLALLVWGSLATAYTVGGRVLRSVA